MGRIKLTMTYFKQNKQHIQRTGGKKAQGLSKEEWTGLAEASGTGEKMHLDMALSAKLRHLDIVLQVTRVHRKQ